MKPYKRLKDPIYGYIDISTNYMTDIVDTSSFQRLRRIIQTSYSPLYSSAVHNRFVHSLGVFHLGEIASQTIKNEILKKGFECRNLDRTCEIFKLACMLHDVGHAPFSHTGEHFYLDDKSSYEPLHRKLIELVGIEAFRDDVPFQDTSAAAPHEIMSAIVGIKEFNEFFHGAEEREFFARCITGYKYSKPNDKNSIYNCFINLLNSKVIDVDKLDYLIRDAYITGFDTVNIDYARLLQSLTLVYIDGNYEIAYYKDAISVIENVVYAHDSERKWIQNHPVVMYEGYILQHIISGLNAKMNSTDSKLFSLKSLGKEKNQFDGNISISLMCDDDIIYLMKNIYSDELSEEFFERRSRRHPLWKSEAEYKAYFDGKTKGGTVLTDFEKAMELTSRYLLKSSDSWVINESAIDKLKSDLEEVEKASITPKTKEVQIRDKTAILKIMECLHRYSVENDHICDFVILRVSQFNSGFGKPDFSKTKIVFPSAKEELITEFGVIASSLKARDKERDNFFYLFYKRNNNNAINKKELSKQLLIQFF